MRSCALVLVLILVLGSLASATAFAQDDSARVFVSFRGDAAESKTLSQAESRFTAPVLSAGGVVFAGSSEMDSVYANCREQIGVDASVERECRLQAARRVFVEHLLEIGATAKKSGFELTLTVWDPSSNAQLHVAYVEAPGSLAEAAEAALPELAASYLCFRGKSEHCGAVRKPTAVKADGGKCPFGREQNTDTKGYCCWPGQAWNGSDCVGSPTRCPDGWQANTQAQSCEEVPCRAGQQKVDESHCCWPGQAYASSQQKCVGVPVCPVDFVAVDEACVLAFGAIELAEPAGALAVLTQPGGLRREASLPTSFSELPTGLYHLVVTAPGSLPWERDLEVLPQQVTRPELQLSEDPVQRAFVDAGFDAEAIAALQAAGVLFDANAAELLGRLAPRGYTPADLVKLQQERQIFGRPATEGEVLALCHSAGLNLAESEEILGVLEQSDYESEWSLARALNDGGYDPEETWLDVTELTLGAVGVGLIVGGAFAMSSTGENATIEESNAADSLGLVMMTGGGGLLLTSAIMIIVDAANVGTLDDDFFDGASKAEIREAFSDRKAGGELSVAPWITAEGAGAGMVWRW